MKAPKHKGVKILTIKVYVDDEGIGSHVKTNKRRGGLSFKEILASREAVEDHLNKLIKSFKD